MRTKWLTVLFSPSDLKDSFELSVLPLSPNSMYKFELPVLPLSLDSVNKFFVRTNSVGRSIKLVTNVAFILFSRFFVHASAVLLRWDNRMRRI